MVNIFGTPSVGHGQSAAIPGPPGPAGGIKDLTLWFPDMMCEQIRKKLNVLTLLIDTIPPSKDPDVELSPEKEIKKWKSFNNRDHMFLTPVNHEKGGQLEEIPQSDPPRYGLKFDKKKQIMYHLVPGRTILSLSGGVLLTLTFHVGVVSSPWDNFVNSNDEDHEEFIISDYRYSKSFDKSSLKFRGVSIIAKPDKKFDLFLHGAISEDGQNRLKIATHLKQGVFYTLQVYWMRGNYKVNGNGFYSLYTNEEPLIDETSFRYSPLPFILIPVFYLGGFNASREEESQKTPVIKSKCFTGTVCNLEIILVNADNDSLPEELLKFIVKKQSVYIAPWLQASAAALTTTTITTSSSNNSDQITPVARTLNENKDEEEEENDSLCAKRTKVM